MTDIRVYKLLLDISRVPLVDNITLKLKVDRKLFNDVIYLTMMNVSNNINFITLEDLILGRIQDKLKYKENAVTFLHRSDDMKELIEQQRLNRK